MFDRIKHAYIGTGLGFVVGLFAWVFGVAPGLDGWVFLSFLGTIGICMVVGAALGFLFKHKVRAYFSRFIEDLTKEI